MLWNGERGKTFFFQSELPYDVSQANYGDKGFLGYRVSGNVTEHDAYGIGVYHFMRDNAVTIQTGISVPPALVSRVRNPLGVYLSGNGIMKHVINDLGPTTEGPNGGYAQWYCSG